MVKNLPANAGDAGDRVSIPGWRGFPGIRNIPYILAWGIPQIEEPGGLQSMGLHRVKHDLVAEHTYPILLCVCVCVCV